MKNKQISIALIFIYFLALIVKIWFIKDGTFNFGFDQARDAVYAQEILSGDLKIFGPTASGTNDTVFHGVFYYYVLAIIHLFVKDPTMVAIALAMISSLSVFPVFLLADKLIKNKKLSLLAALMTAFSYEQVTTGTWISNPVLAILTLPCFFYFYHRVGQKLNRRNMNLMMLFLGLSIQSIFFEIYWLIAVVILFILYLAQNKRQISKNELKIWLEGVFVLSITISSMILSEVLMIQRGILNFKSLATFNNGSVDSPFKLILEISEMLINKASLSFSPRVGLFILMSTSFYLILVKINQKFDYLKILLITPFLFLFVYFRNTLHILISYEILLYLLLLVVISNLFNKIKVKYFKPLFVLTFLCLTIFLNINSLKEVKITRNHPNSVQKGFLYGENKDLIEKAFEIANGENFTISTLTNPYAVNVTWGYLFDYIGNKDYGYEPSYFGFNQAGWVGENLLKSVDEPAAIHFAIIEPDTGLDDYFIQKFINEQQDWSGTPSASYNFGRLELIQF